MISAFPLLLLAREVPACLGSACEPAMPVLRLNVHWWGGFRTLAAARQGNSRTARKLKHKRAKATFKRNICDAKVTRAEMVTKGVETPRMSRNPAMKRRVFDRKLTSRSLSIHASMLSFPHFGRDVRKSGQGPDKMNFLTQLIGYAAAIREFVAPTYRPERYYMRGPGPACARRGTSLGAH
ncbi:hypothetical protein NKI12_03565 [Mesorhizobium australicum]|uniref:Uncharacterized protein n=1 Tax=Mesorhizobium australicum TaxID=536018 RepID=A0ACC6SUT0_9HYPH